MARSTFNDKVTRYRFSATGDGFSLPPVCLSVAKHPFELRDYFELDEAKAIRDELSAAIEEVENRQKLEAEAEQEGRELHALDGGAA